MNGKDKQIEWSMSQGDMVRLYVHLSEHFELLDNPMKKVLHDLEKRMFASLTIAQVQDLTESITGDS